MSIDIVGKAVSNPPTGPKRVPFEGVDLSAAGRKGGHASGVARRLKVQRDLERRILESKNGAAHLRLLQLKRKDEAQLLEEQRRLDYHVCDLLDMKSAVEREIDQLQERANRLESELRQRIDGLGEGVEALEAHESRLRAAIDADERALVDRLHKLNEAGQLDDVLEATGLLERIDDGEVG
jgi:hypothetical protein